MEGIRFDGLSTGLQTSSLIDALINFERRPLSLIQQRQSRIESQRDLFRQLNTDLKALEEAVKALDNHTSLLTGPTLDEELLAYTATSADDSYVTATATGNASPGTLDVEITALAQVGRQMSFGFASDTTSIASSGETLSIDYGGASNIDITVGASGASLQDLKTLVNTDPNNGGAVRADVLFDGSTYRLVLAGTATGAANDLSITTNATGPGGIGPFIDAAQTQAASDAGLTVLGIPITRESNTIDDLFGGLTLELHAQHAPATSTSIEITRDAEAIEAKLQAVVDAYNKVRQFVIDQSRYDEQTETAGILSGDSTLRGIDRQLQQSIGAVYSFAGNPFSSLSQIGMQFDRDGLLSLDSDALTSALDQDPAAVRQLLAGDGSTADLDGDGRPDGDGAATALARELVNLTRDVDGTLANRDDAFERQISALDQSIERFEQRLAMREEMLIERFSRLETLINGLQAQGGFISSIVANRTES